MTLDLSQQHAPSSGLFPRLRGRPALENRSDLPRRAVVVTPVRDGVRSASNQPLLTGAPAIRAGQPLGGRFFPLLFDPARPGGPGGEGSS